MPRFIATTPFFMNAADAGTAGAGTQTDPNAAAAAAAAGTQTGADAGKDTQQQSGDEAGKNGSTQSSAPADLFAELDADTREWLTKRDLADPLKIAKHAREQDKLLGNAIRIPGKDAKPEERDAFLNKLGRPAEPDGYEFTVPKELPEELPYDGERASEFKAFAHTLGLTKEQAAALHDWTIEKQVADFKGSAQQQTNKVVETAKAETDKLVKRWGPLDAPAAKANLEYADRFIMTAGGPEAYAELERLGAVVTVGKDKIVASAALAEMFANAGMAVFKEGEMLRGTADKLGNPFEDGKNFNFTRAMQAIKEDPDNARSLIAAAGKKPSDFGLSDN